MQALFGFAAAVGGSFLLIKASVILATGSQPPILFEVSPAFLAVALQGLMVVFVRPDGSRRLLIQIMIVLVFVTAIGGLTLEEDGGSDLEGAISSLFDVIAGLGPVALLVALGLPIFRKQLWPGRWRLLPISLGAAIIPAIAIGVVLETVIGERALEVPLAAIGAGWMLIGYGLWKTPDTRDRPSG